MRRSTILVVAIAFVLGGALGTVGLLAGHVLKPGSAAVPRLSQSAQTKLPPINPGRFIEHRRQAVERSPSGGREKKPPGLVADCTMQGRAGRDFIVR